MKDDADRTAYLRAHPRRDLDLGARMERFVRALQHRICRAVEGLERAAGSEASFSEDGWAMPDERGGGGGTARVLEGGTVIEKGGVNVSAVTGVLPERTAALLGSAPRPFFATGLSLVLHPRNPYVPAVHANFRYFRLGTDPFAPEDQWFGGGADLTPVYPFDADARHFHETWARVCGEHSEVADYAAFKAGCDAYFYLPHRGETRGVGGIFFDHLRDDPEGVFSFVRAAGRAFLPAWFPVAERRRETPFGEREREYQAIRRGRYAEFNLAYDRGTRFGLETGGRTESILMSLPPNVAWRYDWRPEPGTPEDRALAYFRPRDWTGEEG